MLSLSMVDTNPASLFLFFLIFLWTVGLLFLYIILRPCPAKIPIKGRHVFITGGSYGIGLALAHRAAMEGARVSIMARSLPKLQEARELIQRDTGNEVAVYAADARDFEAVRRAVEDARPIDVLVVNHGVYKAEELEAQELDEVRYILEVNMMGTFNVIKAALPSMKRRKDRRPVSIALMSSQAGLEMVGIYGYAAYCCTKFGLRGLAESLQQEVNGDDIYVSVICPPDTPTPGLEIDKRTRPHSTTVITSSSPIVEANEVAKRALRGIKSGNFMIPCNFKGLLLSIAVASFSTQRSFARAYVEVVAAGTARLVAFWYQQNWYRAIRKFHAQQV